MKKLIVSLFLIVAMITTGLMTYTSTIDSNLLFGAVSASAINKDPLRCDNQGDYIDTSKADKPCTPCPKNFYCPNLANGIATETPTPCPKDTVTVTFIKSLVNGVITMIPNTLATGAYYLQQCECPPTYEYIMVGIVKSCVIKCPQGQVRDAANQTNCVPVPPNPCPANQYGPGLPNCTQCPTGTATQPGSVATIIGNCILIPVPCTLNNFSLTGMTPCNPCPAGYTVTADFKNCTPPPCPTNATRNPTTLNCDCTIAGQTYNPATNTCGSTEKVVVCTIEGQTLVNGACVCPKNYTVQTKKGVTKCTKKTNNTIAKVGLLAGAAALITFFATRKPKPKDCTAKDQKAIANLNTQIATLKASNTDGKNDTLIAKTEKALDNLVAKNAQYNNANCQPTSTPKIDVPKDCSAKDQKAIALINAKITKLEEAKDRGVDLNKAYPSTAKGAAGFNYDNQLDEALANRKVLVDANASYNNENCKPTTYTPKPKTPGSCPKFANKGNTILAGEITKAIKAKGSSLTLPEYKDVVLSAKGFQNAKDFVQTDICTFTLPTPPKTPAKG
jgi:hypothetical protein